MPSSRQHLPVVRHKRTARLRGIGLPRSLAVSCPEVKRYCLCQIQLVGSVVNQHFEVVEEVVAYHAFGARETYQGELQ